VGWVVTPSFVAWVPLAPGEIYYGYGYFGPWSRNITTINVNTSAVNWRYRNADARNAVVTVQRETFGTGRRIPVKIDENPFIGVKPHPAGTIDIVPPREKPRHPIQIRPTTDLEHPQHQVPERERIRPEVSDHRVVVQPERPQRPGSALPAIVQRPSGQVVPPPERFRRIRPEEMKNERRLIKERDASVFRSQPPENLPVRKTREPKTIIRKPGQLGQQPEKINKGEGREKRP
jgi:hypothetical protein